MQATAGPIHRFLASDHARLDALLQRAVARDDEVDRPAYAAFRAGLLKHIGMEEKILLPEIRRAQDGRPYDRAERLRLDHGAIAALLVPTPTPSIVAALRAILTAHNPLEEAPGGLYELADRVLGENAGAVLARLQGAPDVPVAAYSDGARVMEATRRALARAGYDLGAYER